MFNFAMFLRDESGATAVGRSMFDAPEIDGVVHINNGAELAAGEFAWVRIERHDEHDLYGHCVGRSVDVL